MDIINVNDVCLTLGKTEILKHINVSFEKGKIHGLIGRNGSGKMCIRDSYGRSGTYCGNVSVIISTVINRTKHIRACFKI